MQVYNTLNFTLSRLQAAYQGYSPDEQVVLQVLAVIYKPIAQTKFAQILRLVDNAYLYPELTLSKALTPEFKQTAQTAGLLSIDKHGIQISRTISTELTQASISQQTYYDLLSICEQISPVMPQYGYFNSQFDEMRWARDTLFLGEFQSCEILLREKLAATKGQADVSFLLDACFKPFNKDYFLALPESLQQLAFDLLIVNFKQNGISLAPIETVLAELIEHYQYAQLFEVWQALCLVLNKPVANHPLKVMELVACESFLAGNTTQALADFTNALNHFHHGKSFFDEVGLLHILALLKHAASGSTHDIEQVEKAIKQYKKADHPLGLGPLSEGFTLILATLTGADPSAQLSRLQLAGFAAGSYGYHLLQLLSALALTIYKSNLNQAKKNKLEEAEAFFARVGTHLFAEFCRDLLTPNSKSNRLNLAEFAQAKSAWEVALNRLEALTIKPAVTADKTQQPEVYRCVWQLHMSRFGDELVPRQQKLTKSGWSKGKEIPLKRLFYQADEFSFLNADDRKLCNLIRKSAGAHNEFELSGKRALLQASKMDNLYRQDDFSEPLKLTPIDPVLQVQQQNDTVLITLEPAPNSDQEAFQGYRLIEKSLYHFHFICFQSAHLEVANIIGETGLEVPLSAKQSAIASLSKLTDVIDIDSSFAELTAHLSEQPLDYRLYILIEPLQDGLSFSAVFKPFGEQGPAYSPLEGQVHISAELNGKRLAGQRDFLKEQALLDLLDNHCPAFLACANNKLQLSEVNSALECLQVLTDYQANQTETNPLQLVLQWPKGKQIRLSKELKAEHINLASYKNNQWFDLSAEVTLDSGVVLNLKQLLSLAQQGHGRFIKLSENELLVLSEALSEKLVTLSQITESGQFHPLALTQVQQTVQGMRMKTLHAWDKQKAKMDDAYQMQLAPPKLAVPLRDYQLDGYDFAMRLAHWGAGAVLADDMGLGKTIQALAVINARAQRGPSLVIAPTSVCFNWRNETKRFAPNLELVLLSELSSEAREQAIANARPYQLLVVSYGLLVRDIAHFEKHTFSTIVADEAQALKNPLTQRSKAAYELKAEFKMATTGTPIENNLTELWSLFRFTNPGLLGNLKRFHSKFANPIENAKNDKLAALRARTGLKMLISPFILRRLKSQVLRELPSRTEITLTVPLSQEERDFYEGLRQLAIESIMALGMQGDVNKQRMQMLAELTRLRMAACHPKLVIPQSDLASSKLKQLEILLGELLENNHKVLIFSQFVSHLKLIEQHLKTEQISYQYLDGSTSKSKREQAVSAFQHGQGEVFLISLKAGGTGLNLTAADYVIHMDPWWNPAVEDQASDRAHRLGQTRPVTIYRLIAEHTIEEKIVSLHQDKKALADNLLKGEEAASSLSVDEIMAMLQETF